MGSATLPVMKTLAEFDLVASPMNATMVGDLHEDNFSIDNRNAVLIDGAGSSNSHLAITIGANSEREARVRSIDTDDFY